MWMYCYWIVIYLFIHLPIHLFIYSFVIIINWLLVKHSIFTSDFPEPPRHLVYFCVGWGGMVLMSWSEWRWRKGVSTMYCIMQVSMCGPGGRAVWAYVKHLNIFFFLGGGGGGVQISDPWAWKMVQIWQNVLRGQRKCSNYLLLFCLLFVLRLFYARTNPIPLPRS